jgi:hypothetical protein
MPSNSRVRRPKSERSAPIRNSGFFKPAQANSPEPPGANGGTADDALDAYRVMEEQMRAGAFKAQQQSSPLMGAMNGSGGLPPGLNGNFFSQWMGMYMQMLNMGMKAMENFADLRPGQSGPIPFPTADQQAFAGETPGTQAEGDAPVRFKLNCNRPAEVSIDLRRFNPGEYQVQALYSAEQDCQPLDDIKLSQGDDIFTIALVIPADQAEGIYMGAIVSESDNTACGTITVKL